MSTSKHIDKICLAAALLALLLTFVFAAGERFGIQPASTALGYESLLFNTSSVHTIDIVMDDWDDFIETCENEEYAVCSVVIDNEAYKNVGIRAKGNTSLSSVSQLGSQRYSFKIEFDHYDSTKSYHGLDKLCLNNLIQDNTMMKDYLTYQMMGTFDVSAPLCSFVYITVNGEDWGLYVAVEGVEDAFLQRNYGSDVGELYKPDSLSMGGGPGNGRDFNMDEFVEQFGGEQVSPAGTPTAEPGETYGDFTPPEFSENADLNSQLKPDGMGGGFDGGMGSSDTKLQYIDDAPESYSNIFENAKTDISEADQQRLIAALKALGDGDIESSVDIDQVLRYFVVHNFVVNGDSYTGSMIHNYYLYEQNGLLAMIPWDYNLAFGGFQSSDASSTVNDPIDTPLSVTGDGTRPMIDWIFQNEEYTALYHQYFAEFLDTVDIAAIIDNAYMLIAPYVEKDPTKFCTYEEFEQGVSVLQKFCQLRVESVSGQLDGSIPSTSSGQLAEPAALVDASEITISDMGSMANGMGGGRGGKNFPAGEHTGMRGQNQNIQSQTASSVESNNANAETPPTMTEPSNKSPANSSPEAESNRIPSPAKEAETESMVQPPNPEMENSQLPAPGSNARTTGFSSPTHMPQDGNVPPASSSSSSRNALILLGVSMLILLLGLIAAYQFKRYGRLKKSRRNPNKTG